MPPISFWERRDFLIFTFYRAGILTGGDKKGTFYPNQSITRAEVATILSRMMDPNARRTFVLQ